MAQGLSMSYEEMESIMKRLEGLVDQFQDTVQTMTTNVNTLCDNWTAEASDIYREDYLSLANNVSKTSEVVTNMIASTREYVAKMQELDRAYAKNNRLMKQENSN